MFALEARDRHGWHKLGQLYVSAEEALREAAHLWESEFNYTHVRIMETAAICTLVRPEPDEER